MALSDKAKRRTAAASLAVGEQLLPGTAWVKSLVIGLILAGA